MADSIKIISIRPRIAATAASSRLSSKLSQRFTLPKSPSSSTPHDIVYCCGSNSIVWDPEDDALGGSEQAVVELSSLWSADHGLKVAVYGNFAFENKTYKGVNYFNFDTHFDPHAIFKTIILWRHSGIAPFCDDSVILKCNNVLIDLHDNCPETYELIAKHLARFQNNKVMRIMTKSKYHRQCVLEAFSQCASLTKFPKIESVMNGVRVQKFAELPENTPSRNPFRFCYTSCYTRGLEEILQYFWPLMKQMEPRSELHIYYGTDMLEKRYPEYAVKIKNLIGSSKGVCDHGRQDVNIIAREKWMSTFHMYITATQGETDCIAIRESLVAGCIPILLNKNVFQERDGIHVSVGTTTVETAQMLLDLMKKPDELEALRARLAKSPTIVTWEQIATQWTKWLV